MSDASLQSVTQPVELSAERPSVNLAEGFARCAFLLFRSIRRQLLSKQTLVALLLAGVCGLIVLAWAQQRHPTPKRFAEMMLIPTYIAFLMPILAVCYGASSIGGEREDGTLIYLLIASIPRPLVFTVKFMATMLLSGTLAAATLGALCLLGGASGRAAWPIFWPAGVLGAMTYAGLFLTFGAAFRHGTVLSLAYWFFLEVLIGNLPGIINRWSLVFYVRCLIYEAGSRYDIRPLGEESQIQFHPIPGPTAAVTLLSLLGALFVIGMITFSRKEYHEVS
jgi:ABC-type transport system involved in multi-copper enzyme maturation permease subunit